MLKKTRRVIAIGIIAAALAVLVGRLAINHFALKNDFIQQVATRAIGYPVSIHHVAIQWRGFYPVFVLRDVMISDPQNVPAVRINRLNIGINILSSLLHREFIPGTLEASGADLGLFQDANGQWQLIGMDNSPNTHPTAFGDWFDWLLSQNKIVLSDIQITLKKSATQIIPVSIKKIELYQALGGIRAEGDVSFLQPKSGTLHMMAKLSRSHQFKSLVATIYLGVKQVDLSTWLAGVPFQEWSIEKGLVDADVWLHWQNDTWQEIQLVLDGKNIVAKNKKSTYVVDTQKSQIEWKRLTQDAWQLQASINDLSIDEKSLINEPIEFLYKQDKKSRDLQIMHLTFNTIYRILSKFQMLASSQMDMLKGLAISGNLDNLYLHQEGDKWLVDGELQHINSSPLEKIPGTHNLTGRFQVTPQEGYFNLDSKNTILNFTHVFRKAIPLDSAHALAHWTIMDEGVLVQVDDAQVENSDGAVYGKFRLYFPKGESYPWLSLVAGGNLTSLNNASWYLPFSVMPKEVLNWVDQAILPGEARVSAGVVINGSMEDFPFDDNSGQFIVDANLENVDLRFQKSWPPIHGLSGNIVFHDRSMNLKTASASLAKSTQLHHLQASIPSMGGKIPAVLGVSGIAEGDISDALHFIQDSPLNGILKYRFDHATGRGPLLLKLGLSIPLSDSSKEVKVNGDLTLKDNSLEADGVELKKLQGNIIFTEQGMTSPLIQGKLFDTPIKINMVDTIENNLSQTKIQVSGMFTVEMLEKIFQKPALSHYFSGGSDFQAIFKVFHYGSKGAAPSDTLQVTSNLKGVSVNMPEPLKKSAEAPRDASLLVTWVGSGTQIQFNDGNGTQLSMNSSTGDSVIGIKNSLIDGQVFFGDYPRSLKLRLNYLNLSDTSHVHASDVEPQSLPMLDVDCDSVKIGNKNLGHVTLVTTPNRQGMEIIRFNINAQNYQLQSRGSWSKRSREEFTQLSGRANSDNTAGMLHDFGMASGVMSDDASANFSLTWPGSPMDFETKNLSGNVSIRIKNGSIPDVGSSTNLKLGLGRIITLLSFQSLQQKLQLNFNDFTSKGYSFNIFSGQINLREGQAYTQDMMMDGSIAKIKMGGRIGLAAHDYDINLAVTPYVTSSIPVIATLAGGPVVGAVAWLTDKVLSPAVQKITTYHYHVVGPWDKPDIRRD